MLRKRCLLAGLCACLFMAHVGATESSMAVAPALSRWVADVLTENPGVQAANASVEAARASVRAADRPLFNPELQFEYENSETETTAGGISQAIDWNGKRGARTAVADQELATAEAERDGVRQALVIELLSSLAEFHTADSLGRLAEERGELMTRFANLAERRRKAGDLSRVEFDLAQLAEAEAQFQKAEASANEIRARQALIALTGPSRAAWPPFPSELPAVDIQQLDHDALLRELPTVRANLARMASARAAVQLRNRERRPDPTFGIRAGKEDSETLTGLSIAIPLYVRNTFRAEVDIASAELIQTERDAANVYQRAGARLESAVQVYQLSRSAWLAWEQAGQASLSNQIDLLDRLWQAGEINTTDYLVQLKQALDTKAGAIEQRGRMWQAWIDWLAASGQVESELQIGEKKQ